MKFSKLALLYFVSTSIVTSTFACDLCGCYLPAQEFIHHRPYGIYAAVAEQFTHLGTLQFNDQEIDNPMGQYLDSSNTQLILGSTFFENRFALQVNIPLIYRSFKRPEGFEIERGNVSGLGDIALLANLVVFRKNALFHQSNDGLSKDGKNALVPQLGEPDFSATLNLIAGVKFPTGDASLIREEFNETEVEGAPENGIHGHDLALGTGSYDAIFGAQAFVRYKMMFFEADTQFTLRGDGRYSYHYANDLSWSGGPGAYLILNGRNSLGLQCVVSGESKNTDRFQGRVAEDSGITSLYVGPRVIAQFQGWSGDVGVDIPVIMNTTKLQTVPEYRIRAGITFPF